MSTIMTERTARKEHRCGRCRQPIRPGTRYREWNLPPGGVWPDAGNTCWLRERVHLTYGECQSRPCELRCPLALNLAIETPCCVCLAPEPRAAA